MAVEKLNTWLKNKTSTKPRIKHYNKNHNLRQIRPHTQHNNPEHIFKILNTTTTICGENCDSSSLTQIKFLHLEI